MRRWVVAAGALVAVVIGYGALDVTDAAPGPLTSRPLPPPAPTETPGTRTLPVVPQPTVPMSVGPPLPGLAGPAASPTAEGVARATAAARALPALRDSALVVRDGQTGAVLYEQRPEELRIPASTTKILSAAAIGQAFAPDARLTTRVVLRGSGDVVLVAGGDSLLAPGRGNPRAVAGRAGLTDLAAAVATSLRARGLTRVRLSVDLTYAPGPTIAPTWAESFRPLGITGAVAMLGRSDQRAVVGRAAPADPVGSTVGLFAQRLGERGVTTTRTRAAPPGSTGADVALGAVQSAPVRDQLALALTESDNALIEILARQAAFRGGARTDFASTGEWVVSQVKALGVDTTGVVLRDASGLSRENRVSAGLLADVLVLGYDGRHPVLRSALEGLPIAGLTGTLADRYTANPTRVAAGRARAKTGTLTGANALAGSVVTDSGRLVVFAGLVADAGTLDARAALDRFVTAVASCGCR